jgi:hypothetical protein
LSSRFSALGASIPPFIMSTITYKVVVYAPAQWAGTLPLFLLYPHMYSLVAPGIKLVRCFVKLAGQLA